jgi:hypothetical protein
MSKIHMVPGFSNQFSLIRLTQGVGGSEKYFPEL